MVASALEAALEASGVLASPPCLPRQRRRADGGWRWQSQAGERAAADAGLPSSHGARFIVDWAWTSRHRLYPKTTRRMRTPAVSSMPAPRIAAAQGARPLAPMGAEGDAALKRLRGRAASGGASGI